MAIHILSKYGISPKEVKYELPVDIANQLLSCHWISLGLEVEYCVPRNDTREEIKETIQKTAKRKHKWQLELP